MKTRYDVIIIGAGPAGCTCAKVLHESGLRTLIIEKQKLPYKKTCSGLYEERSIQFIEENFGTIPESLFYKNKILDVQISKTGKSFFQIPNVQYWNLNRPELDYWLIKKSKTQVEENCRFLTIDKSDPIIQITCQKNKKIVRYTCKYLIGADGAHSITRSKVDTNYHIDFGKIGLVEQHIYKGSIDLDCNSYYISQGKKFRNLGMACVFQKDEQIIIATQFQKDKAYFSNWIERLKESHDAQLELLHKERIGIIRCIFSESDLFLGKNNIFLTGEASGLISVFTGGISSALISGKILANAILTSNTNAILSKYRQQLESEIVFLKESWNKNSKL